MHSCGSSQQVSEPVHARAIGKVAGAGHDCCVGQCSLMGCNSANDPLALPHCAGADAAFLFGLAPQALRGQPITKVCRPSGWWAGLGGALVLTWSNHCQHNLIGCCIWLLLQHTSLS